MTTNAPLTGPCGIGVYIHVPYCRVVCPYCDFVKKAAKGDAPEAFAAAVHREIEAFEGPRDAISIFFGGGTPSLLARETIGRILQVVHRKFRLVEAEISMEVNPDDVTVERARAWRALGFNRVIIGVQSFNDECLRYLGRVHDAAAARRACGIVAEIFDNWGMDLIFGAPPIDAWEDSLAECLRFAPRHVSTYSLTFEEGTPFWKRRGEAIDDDTSVELYRRGHEALGGYDHYEVSNFALDGYQCRHNRIYWRNEEYAGFGPGAYSFVEGMRSRNEPKIDAYLRSPGRKSETLRLSGAEIRVETMIQHFRTRRGITRDYYEARFGRRLEHDFGRALRTLEDRGLVEQWENGYRPTWAGYELNDEIGLMFVEPPQTTRIRGIGPREGIGIRA